MRERRPSEDPTTELFRTAFDGAPIGMCLVGPDGRCVEVNAALCELLHGEAQALVGLCFADLVHPEDQGRCAALLDELSGGGAERGELRATCVRPDGAAVPVLVTVAGVRDASGAHAWIIAQVQDLTLQLDAERALRNAEEAHRRVLERQARCDSVTGLANRRGLRERLEGALRDGSPGAQGTALLFCDLDTFKDVNDAHGHATGDDLLVAVARRLEAAARDGDTVCRFGGGKFVLVGAVGSVEDALALATKCAAVFERPFAVSGREFLVTVSVGVVYAARGSRETVDSLTRYADAAMCRARALGRNKVVVFSEALRQQMLEQITLETELRAALSTEQIICHYQPIIDLGSRKAARVEALVRWLHPERGVVPPGDFLPVASRCGLMGHLGEHVLTQAVSQAAHWRRGGREVEVAVNVDSQQLSSVLPRLISRTLETHGLPANLLCLELTERALFDAHAANLATLREISALGVRLAVDDFGTGYSSFAYLRDLPVHEVKLDRSFIARLTTDERDVRVVAGMIRLAHELGLRVVAEGVETEAQLQALLELGCDDAQGFLFARPSPNPFTVDISGFPARTVA